MKCHELAARIEAREPTMPLCDVARLCLILSHDVQNLTSLEDETCLQDSLQQMQMKVHAAADQHAAMTRELEALASSDPKEFQPEQVWVLVRAIKVQSQILEMYLGEPALDV